MKRPTLAEKLAAASEVCRRIDDALSAWAACKADLESKPATESQRV